MMTPGPWDAAGFSVVKDGRTVAICSPDLSLSGLDSLARMKANAKAIAALPAMIAALRQSLNKAVFPEQARRSAEEALTLAGIEP